MCFLNKPAAAVLGTDPIGRQYRDYHLTIETRIPSAIHLARPARANEGEDLVRPECRAGLESHGFGVIIGAGAMPITASL